MGKAKTKDKGYITMKEWVAEWGGKSDEIEKRQFSKLPFHYCAISFQPFSTPVCTPDGHIFDLMNIVPYIKKHKTNPVTGSPLATKDLIRLNIHKNSEGEFSCPVTFKVFTDNVHIVALRNTGNVFSYEAVEQFNLKPKFMFDLINNQAFTKPDIIHLQDPMKIERRNASQFYHVQHSLSAAQEGESSALANVRTTPAIERVLAHVTKKNNETAPPQATGTTTTTTPHTPQDPNIIQQKRSYSSGKMAASLTSTAVDIETTNANIVETIRRQLKPKKKGYVRLKTNLGDLNIELHCDKTPMTCENFIRLCEKGYYNDVIFHRNIPKFMIQGGDPTGTGTGGDSFFGGTFADEIRETLRHNERGVVSMANRGPSTNTSQFFICYKAARHLDNLHTVFGRVVGGFDVLDAMEAVKTKNDKPVVEIKILSAIVFVNPYDEMLAAEKAEKEKIEKQTPVFVNEAESGQWYSNPKPNLPAKRTNVVIGKYLSDDKAKDAPVIDQDDDREDDDAQAMESLRKKKPRLNSQLVDFSGW